MLNVSRPSSVRIRLFFHFSGPIMFALGSVDRMTDGLDQFRVGLIRARLKSPRVGSNGRKLASR